VVVVVGEDQDFKKNFAGKKEGNILNINTRN
jgi:hypothetical protein